MNVTKSFITANIRGGANTQSLGPMTIDTVVEQAQRLSEYDFTMTFDAQVESRKAAIRELYGLPADATAFDVFAAAKK